MDKLECYSEFNCAKNIDLLPPVLSIASSHADAHGDTDGNLYNGDGDGHCHSDPGMHYCVRLSQRRGVRYEQRHMHHYLRHR